jgi:transcription elongation factor Elf1
MEQHTLKKQFGEKDVQRMRNLIQGKFGDKSTIGIGYSKSVEDHKEGDVWSENGREWKIENGVKQNITKLDKFKNLNIPLFCPSCKGIMNKTLDSTAYRSHLTCFNCYTKFETELKINGKWEEYQKETHNKEIDQLITEYTNYITSEIEEQNNSFVAENGDVEKWDGKIDKERANQALQDTIIYLESLKIS